MIYPNTYVPSSPPSLSFLLPRPSPPPPSPPPSSNGTSPCLLFFSCWPTPDHYHHHPLRFPQQKAYGLAGRWEDALELVPRAAEAGVAPDERMYCAVINAMGESGAWDRAVALVRWMRLATTTSSSSSSPLSLPPFHDGGGGGGGGEGVAGSVNLRSTATGVASAAPSDKLSVSAVNDHGDGNTAAIALAKRAAAAAAACASSGLDPARLPLQAPLPGRPAYGCACRACARQGEWAAVLELIADMRENGVARDAAVYALAMRALVEAGEWKRAVEVVTVEVCALREGSKRGRGGGSIHFRRSRSRLIIAPRIPTVPGRSTSSFHRPGNVACTKREALGEGKGEGREGERGRL